MNWWTWLLTALLRRQVIVVPAGHLSSVLAFDAVPQRAALGAGLAAAVVDGGIVQGAIQATHGPSWLGRLKRQRSSWREPTLVMWSRNWVPVRVAVPSIVSRDGHGFTVSVDLRVRLEPRSEAGATLPTLPETAASLGDLLRVALTAALHAPARQVDGANLFDDWPGEAAVLARCLEAASGAVSGLAVVDGGCSLSAANAFFEARREQERQHQQDLASLDALREQSLIRGAVRLVAHQERIDSLQKESEYAAAEAMLHNDVELRRKALSQELERADVDAAIEKVGIARRQAEAVIDMVDAASRMQSKLFESAGQLAAHLSAEMGTKCGGSAFTAQERQQAQALLAAAARTARSPEEVLSALQSGLPLPVSLFRPFRKLEGTHTVKVGTEWKVFDGETLWAIHVTRVHWKRRWWSWGREYPTSVEFKVTGRPEGRELYWGVRAEESCLQVGTRELRGRLVPGAERAAVHLSCAPAPGLPAGVV